MMHGHPLKVLLVDDDNEDHLIVKDLLKESKQRQYDLEWVSNYEDALTQISTMPYDLYLFDYRLDSHTGLDLLHEVIRRKDPTPVILLTGQDDQEVDLQAMKEGASDYLIKGQFDAAQLERAIRYSIEHARILQELRESQEKYQELLHNELISVVSHELRTPLAIFKEAVSILSREKAGSLNDKQKDLLSLAASNAQRLELLINDLLDTSKIEAGQLTMRRELLDVVQLLEESSKGWRLNAQSRKIAVNLQMPDHPIRLSLDPMRFLQIFSNLISNAIKFTPQNGTIEISVKEVDQAVEIAVRDSGRGIAKEEIPQIFKKFNQLKRTHGPGAQGTGLGLSIVRSLVELHGGEIWVDSRLGEGSTFFVRFPKEQGTDTAPQEHQT